MLLPVTIKLWILLLEWFEPGSCDQLSQVLALRYIDTQILRSAYADVLADLSLHCLSENAFGPWLPTESPGKSDQTAQMHRLVWVFTGHTYEAPYDKTYNKTCVTSEDSDQPAHQHSQIWVFADRLLQTPGYPKRDEWEPLGLCTGWFESVQVTQVFS